MKKVYTIITCILFFSNPFLSLAQPQLSDSMLTALAKMPLHCIHQEFPNKTGHVVTDTFDSRQVPSELHPSFYGCFDWHSSVHGHWLLVKLLKSNPNISIKEEAIKVLNSSFESHKIQKEAAYFTQHAINRIFERTYGWAWLLKLDEELASWNEPLAKKWKKALQPLTDTIVVLWKEFLPKQTYPNRTGVHPNTAFGLGFAYVWALQVNDLDFAQQIKEKAFAFYRNNTATPAYLEPDGSDFFSPSLMIADLMTRLLSEKEFTEWIEKFYEPRSLERICHLPTVSDRNDYQIVHLDGLSLSRAWCMKSIAAKLPANHPLRKRFQETAQQFIETTLPTLFKGNYGGEHWLATFAIYAIMIDS